MMNCDSGRDFSLVSLYTFEIITPHTPSGGSSVLPIPKRDTRSQVRTRYTADLSTVTSLLNPHLELRTIGGDTMSVTSPLHVYHWCPMTATLTNSQSPSNIIPLGSSLSRPGLHDIVRPVLPFVCAILCH